MAVDGVQGALALRLGVDEFSITILLLSGKGRQGPPSVSVATPHISESLITAHTHSSVSIISLVFLVAKSPRTHSLCPQSCGCRGGTRPALFDTLRLVQLSHLNLFLHSLASWRFCTPSPFLSWC